MDVSVITTSSGLAGLRTEWEHLEALAPTPYYVTHRFVTAWWASVRQLPGYRLHVVTVRQGGRLVGVGPFAIGPGRRHGSSVPVLRWASHGDYLSVLHAADGDARRETVTDLILTEAMRLLDHRQVARVLLTGIPSESTFAWHVRKSQRYHRHLAFHIENPYLDLTQGYTVPSRARKYRNKLQRDRNVTFAVFHGDQHGIFERIVAVHLAEKKHLVGLGRQERHSLFEDPQRVAHVRAVFTDTDDALTFALVEGSEPASGRVVAYRTVFRHAGRLLSWNSAYLPEYEAYRMGKVLQLEILEHLDEHDPERNMVAQFDLGAGGYPWKFEWTPYLRATYRLLIEAPARPWVRWVEGPVRVLVRRLSDAKR